MCAYTKWTKVQHAGHNACRWLVKERTGSDGFIWLRSSSRHFPNVLVNKLYPHHLEVYPVGLAVPRFG
jgi:hypothetical protein